MTHVIAGAIAGWLVVLAVVVVLLVAGALIPPLPEALERLRDRAQWWVP